MINLIYCICMCSIGVFLTALGGMLPVVLWGTELSIVGVVIGSFDLIFGSCLFGLTLCDDLMNGYLTK